MKDPIEAQAAYRAQCTHRRNGKTIEQMINGNWVQDSSYKGTNAAKRESRSIQGREQGSKPRVMLYKV